MRALVFKVGVPGFLVARSLGRISEAATYGPFSGLRLRDHPAPQLPGPDWVSLEVLGCGICGTDVSNLNYASSPILEPFGSFPAVLGHEVLARVDSVGHAVERVGRGDRVAVDPMLSCTARGYEEAVTCLSCHEGRHATCEMAGEDGERSIGDTPLARGVTIGYHRDLPGGWSERMIVHESQVFPLASELSARAGVLMEPLSIGVHAALNAPPHPQEDVLVIGSGPIAFATIWALRALGFEGAIVSQVKRKHEAALALALGASDIVKPGLEARQALVETGARAYQPFVGDEVFAGGGFPNVFDCVGNASSFAQALRFAAPRGRVVMLGCAGELKRIDLTLVWARELEIRGFVGYGRERWNGEDRHTFEVTQELLLDSRPPVERMVTHVFPLEQYRDALSAAANHRRSEAIRVVLTPRADGQLPE